MRRKQPNERKPKMSMKNGKGMNETILGWFKRVHPEELWAVGEMPPCLTFADMKRSMDAGDGMGEAARHSDTATREMMLDRLAELVGKKSNELVKEANASESGWVAFGNRLPCACRWPRQGRDQGVARHPPNHEVAGRGCGRHFVEGGVPRMSQGGGKWQGQE